MHCIPANTCTGVTYYVALQDPTPGGKSGKGYTRFLHIPSRNCMGIPVTCDTSNKLVPWNTVCFSKHKFKNKEVFAVLGSEMPTCFMTPVGTAGKCTPWSFSRMLRAAHTCPRQTRVSRLEFLLHYKRRNDLEARAVKLLLETEFRGACVVLSAQVVISGSGLRWESA